jgi:hypothetical protein
MKDLDSIAQLDRLLLLVPQGPANFGVVAAPEELGDFSEGDVVRFTDPERIQDCENGSFVFVSPAKCEKVTDPKLVEEYRSIIYGDSWDEDAE